MQYKKYTEEELYAITDKPREISADPYKLFTAMVLQALKEFTILDDEEEEEERKLWGNNIAIQDFQAILKDCIEDFMAAIKEGCRIDIGKGSFTIRNGESVDAEKLRIIFQFPKYTEGYLTISKDGIYNVNGAQQTDSVAEQRRQTARNREMAIRIYYLGNDDEGWFALTDMERAVYTWVIYYQKHKDKLTPNAVEHWYSKYKDYFALPLKDVLSCLKDGLEAPQNAFSFSDDKVQAYNRRTESKSSLSTIDYDTAADHWYKKFA